MDNKNLIILLIIFILIIILSNYYHKNKDLTQVKSTIDNKYYLVAKLIDSNEAANKLALINKNINILLEHCKNPNDKSIMKLYNNYNSDILCELVDKSKYTAYSLNKGELIAICLRDKITNKLIDDMNSKSFIDMNTVMFVIIHELAHVITKSIGHTKEFWDNMTRLLKYGNECGIYKLINYKKNPIYYCNQLLNDTPYDFN